MSRKWQIAIAVFTTLLAVAFWRWPWPLFRQPDLYSLRVQVVDPAHTPVKDSLVRVSAGNEPHLLPDGWWEVQIPRAKVPEDGRVSVWAEHPDWASARSIIQLADDAQPRLELRLETPQSTLSGLVADEHRRGLAGARVSIVEHGAATAETDRDGRFSVRLPVASGTKVRVHVEHPKHAPRDAYCYVGTPCWVDLDV